MMKKLILHIGTPKTGTTAIQSFLNKNKELLTKLDFIYPNAGRIDKNGNNRIAHKLLARAIINKDRHERILHEINTQVADFNGVIISSEAFFGQLHKPEVRECLIEIKNYFKNNDIKILIYLRRWDLYVESLYNQYVSLGVLGMNGKGESIHDFLIHCEKEIGWHPADYVNYLHILEGIFGKNAIEVRSFDPKAFKGGNLICDFCEAVGIDNLDPYRLPKKSNPSYSTKQILVISLLLPLVKRKQTLTKKVKKLFQDDEPSFSPYCLFKQDERLSLIERFRKDEEELKSYMKDSSGILFNLDEIQDKSELPPVQFSFDELVQFRDLILDIKKAT